MSPDAANRFLTRKGLSVKFLQIRFVTNRFNNTFVHWTRGTRLKLWSLWFDAGSIITVGIIPLSIIVLISTLWTSFWSGSVAPGSSLEPVLPGVNVPASEFVFYFTAILIASLIHEAGHAVAASLASVQLEGLGVALFAVIPVAFVELSTENFSRCDVRHRLRIVCAGVWHNIMLAAFCTALLMSQSILLAPFCITGSGATVWSSTSSEQNMLTSGDLIESVNGCPVTGKQSWRQCIANVCLTNQSGFCLTDDFIRRERFHSLDPDHCCAEDLNRSLCFTDSRDENYCLPARLVIDNHVTCDDDTGCRRQSLCFKPREAVNQTRVFHVKRRDKNSFIFLGTGFQLLSSVRITDCESRFWWTPISMIESCDSLIRYLISFSLALAVLNVVPCIHLDGQFIIAVLCEMILSDRFSRTQRMRVCRIASAAGTFLIFACITSAVYRLVLRGWSVSFFGY